MPRPQEELIYTPLYMPNGKRHPKRLYVNQYGYTISRRDYMTHIEGESPEAKALRRYRQGLSKTKGVSARKAEKKEKSTRKAILRTKQMPLGKRGCTMYQLYGDYVFIKGNEDIAGKPVIEKARGYSRMVPSRAGSYYKRGDVYYELQGNVGKEGTSVNNAAAQLEGSDWVWVGIEYEGWLSWRPLKDVKETPV